MNTKVLTAWIFAGLLFAALFGRLLFGQPSTQVLTPARIPVRWVDRGGTNFVEFYDPKITVRIRQGTAADIIISNGVIKLNSVQFPDGTTQTTATGGSNSLSQATNFVAFSNYFLGQLNSNAVYSIAPGIGVQFTTNGFVVTISVTNGILAGTNIYVTNNNGFSIQTVTNFAIFQDCPSIAFVATNGVMYSLRNCGGNFTLIRNTPVHSEVWQSQSNGVFMVSQSANPSSNALFQGVGSLAESQPVRFKFNTNGNLDVLRGLPYEWPTAHAAGILTNDGAGNVGFSRDPNGVTNLTVSNINVTVSVKLKGKDVFTLTNGTGISITTNTTTGVITISATGGTGDVVGPASSTDSALALFDGTTGKLLKNGANSTSSSSIGVLNLGATLGNELRIVADGGVKWHVQTDGDLVADQLGEAIGTSGTPVGSLTASNVTANSFVSVPVTAAYESVSHIFLDARQGNFFNLTATNNFTLHCTNLFAGWNAILNVRQDATGSRIVTLDTAGGSQIKTNATITLSTAAAAKDVIFLATDGTGTNANIILHTSFQ